METNIELAKSLLFHQMSKKIMEYPTNDINIIEYFELINLGYACNEYVLKQISEIENVKIGSDKIAFQEFFLNTSKYFPKISFRNHLVHIEPTDELFQLIYDQSFREYHALKSKKFIIAIIKKYNARYVFSASMLNLYHETFLNNYENEQNPILTEMKNFFLSIKKVDLKIKSSFKHQESKFFYRLRKFENTINFKHNSKK